MYYVTSHGSVRHTTPECPYCVDKIVTEASSKHDALPLCSLCGSDAADSIASVSSPVHSHHALASWICSTQAETSVETPQIDAPMNQNYLLSLSEQQLFGMWERLSNHATTDSELLQYLCKRIIQTAQSYKQLDNLNITHGYQILKDFSQEPLETLIEHLRYLGYSPNEKGFMQVANQQGYQASLPDQIDWTTYAASRKGFIPGLTIPYDASDADDIKRYMLSTIGKPLRDAAIDFQAIIPYLPKRGSCGQYGEAYELCVLGLKKDAAPQPDILPAGIEVKTTLVRHSHLGRPIVRSISCGAVSAQELRGEVTFAESRLLRKCRNIAIVLLEYPNTHHLGNGAMGLPVADIVGDTVIQDYIFFSMDELPPNILRMFEIDYQYIIERIMHHQAIPANATALLRCHTERPNSATKYTWELSGTLMRELYNTTQIIHQSETEADTERQLLTSKVLFATDPHLESRLMRKILDLYDIYAAYKTLVQRALP